jgi:NAD-dependent DNA ligase
MLSLENSYNAEDLRERNQRIFRILEKEENTNQPTYIIEPKFD